MNRFDMKDSHYPLPPLRLRANKEAAGICSLTERRGRNVIRQYVHLCTKSGRALRRYPAGSTSGMVVSGCLTSIRNTARESSTRGDRTRRSSGKPSVKRGPGIEARFAAGNHDGQRRDGWCLHDRRPQLLVASEGCKRSGLISRCVFFQLSARSICSDHSRTPSAEALAARGLFFLQNISNVL